MSGFTPGPWIVDRSRIGDAVTEQIVVRAPTKVYVTTDVVAVINGPKANGDLISAVTDYHAAVELMLADEDERDRHSGYVSITQEAYDALLAAHMKAEGRL